jgi:hypothetical protein
MHNRDKYPEIWAVKEKAEAALAPLMAKRQKHQDDVNKAGKKMQAAHQEKVEANNKSMVDIEEIGALRAEIGRCARAMGSLSV